MTGDVSLAATCSSRGMFNSASDVVANRVFANGGLRSRNGEIFWGAEGSDIAIVLDQPGQLRIGGVFASAALVSFSLGLDEAAEPTSRLHLRAVDRGFDFLNAGGTRVLRINSSGALTFNGCATVQRLALRAGTRLTLLRRLE